MQDYYKVLGVKRDATDKEIRAAFKIKAREFHPDVNKDSSAEDNFKEVSVAFETLTRNRTKYDLDNPPTPERTYSRPERQPSPTPPRQPTQEGDFFKSDFFGEDFFAGTPFGRESHSTKIDGISIPDTDWGLLAALKMAYQSKEDGIWNVKKSESDDREWMPEVVYSIRKISNETVLSRIVKDFRRNGERDRNIFMRKEGPWSAKVTVIAPDAMFDEYYLAGYGLSKFDISPDIPDHLDKYYANLKSLALKLVKNETDKDGNITIDPERMVLNKYAKHDARNVRYEGSLHAKDKDREWVHDVSPKDFWKRMRQAEGRVVRVEGQQKPVEGQQSNPQGTSGEGKG